MTPLEFNFDGLIGPTHNYAGLAQGNLASQENRNLVSHPRAAALQGLEKMKFLADLGVPQAILPPLERPDIPALRRLGFTGSDADILQKAARQAPDLLAACCSASAMWAANAATVAPSADAADGRVHFTPANLSSHLHRSLETTATAAHLRAIFRGPSFVHHDPLPSTPDFSDEGAANHSRLCLNHGDAALELFTYGRDSAASPNARFIPRQTRAAVQAIARLHQLNPDHTFFLQQHPAALDAGVFHNDVIAVAHRHLFLYHEQAYHDAPRIIGTVNDSFLKLTGTPLLSVCIPESLLPLADAVRSYLFNSQIVTLPDDSMALIAPLECREIPAASAAIAYIQEHAPCLRAIHYADVRQSMQNGGGPACLRLRVVLTADQQTQLRRGTLLTEPLYTHLRTWIERHYRPDLHPTDLADPALLTESRTALDELSQLLSLGPCYPFQR